MNCTPHVAVRTNRRSPQPPNNIHPKQSLMYPTTGPLILIPPKTRPNMNTQTLIPLLISQHERRPKTHNHNPQNDLHQNSSRKILPALTPKP